MATGVLVGETVDFMNRSNLSEETKKSHRKNYAQFLEFVNMPSDEFVARAKKDPEFVEKALEEYARRHTDVSGSRIQNIRHAVKFALEMNRAHKGVNWEYVSKVLPHARKVGRDRAPSVEEIRKMLEGSDLRMKAIIMIMASSGIRVGAFDSLSWGDLEPVHENGKTAGAKLVVYRGEPDEYVTFITPECHSILREYRSVREKFGEVITANSPLIREALSPSKLKGPQAARNARGVSSKSIKNEVGNLLWKIGLRTEHKRVHEFKLAHGFRKFFKTRCELAGMKSINVESLMGHSIGVSASYYKPSAKELFEDYKKAIPYLTISEAQQLKSESEKKASQTDAKIGALERELRSLYARIDELEALVEKAIKLRTAKKP